MPLTFPYTFLLLAAGSLLIPGRRRRLALIGLVPVALGIAAITLRLGGDLFGLALRAAERGAPLGFLQINSGLILLGIGLVLVAVGRGLIVGAAQPAIWLAAVLVGAGAAPMVAAHVPLLSYTGWLSPLGAAVGVAAGVVALYALGRVLGLSRLVTWMNQRILDRKPVPATSVTILRVAAAATAGIILIWLRVRAPQGTDYWAPLFMPVALLVGWHGAASNESSNRRGRLVEMLLAMGFFGIFAGGSGTIGAGWLLGAAVIVVGLYPSLTRAPAILLWLSIAWGTLLVFTGGLASQVTYTTLAAGVIAAAIWVYHPLD